MCPWERVAVVGVPGVGKTALCRAVSQNSYYTHVNYGELMLKIAQKDGFAATLPEMFQLSISIQHQIWKNAALKIKDETSVLFDLHGVDHSPEGFLISLPFEILLPDLIIIIEASFDDILRRRNLDLVKERIIEKEQPLNKHMQILRYTMSSISSRLGCSLAILNNHDFKNCQEEIERILK